MSFFWEGTLSDCFSSFQLVLAHFFKLPKSSWQWQKRHLEGWMSVLKTEVGISGCRREGKRRREKKEPKLNTFVSALTYHKSYENRGLIVFTLQVHPHPPTPSPPPNTTTQLHTPTPLSSAAAPPPPPASHSCLQMPPVFVLRVQAQSSRPPQTSGPCLISDFTTWHRYHPHCLPLLTRPTSPRHSSSPQTHWHIHTPQVCYDTQPRRTRPQRLTVRRWSSDHPHKETRLNKMRQNKWCYLHIGNVPINEKEAKIFHFFPTLIRQTTKKIINHVTENNQIWYIMLCMLHSIRLNKNMFWKRGPGFHSVWQSARLTTMTFPRISYAYCQQATGRSGTSPKAVLYLKHL